MKEPSGIPLSKTKLLSIIGGNGLLDPWLTYNTISNKPLTQKTLHLRQSP